MVTKNEIRNILIQEIKKQKKTPLILNINNTEYIWSGGQRIGSNYLYKYRNKNIDIHDEKQIMLPI